MEVIILKTVAYPIRAKKETINKLKKLAVNNDKSMGDMLEFLVNMLEEAKRNVSTDKTAS
jgi:hypothetical protein